MTTELVHISRCWCGSERLTPFADQYLRCDDCGTLINSPRLPDGWFSVGDGERNFYSKDYWLAYQRERHGLPDIAQRARDDLAERCLYWLDTVLRFKRPPGQSLEIGCAHGGFVALMKMAGFNAMGVELSPWVADYAAATFHVPVRCGTLADLEIKAGSMDCVILMDVLEHLPDPKATMCSVARVLKPDGIVVIQTPCYRGEGSDWNMMIDQEHLFLFTEEALRRLLAHEGLNHVAIRPQLFPHDVFLIGGKSLLAETAREDIEASLLGMPDGRLLLALLDLYERFKVSTQTLAEKWQAAESDRAARLAVIEEQGRRLGALEAERAAHLEMLQRQGEEITRLGAERSAFMVQLQPAQDALQTVRHTRVYRLLRQLGRWRFMEQINLQEPAGPTPQIGARCALAAKNASEAIALQALVRPLHFAKGLAQTCVSRLLTRLHHWRPWFKTPSTDAEAIAERLAHKYGTNKHYTKHYYDSLTQTHKGHPLFDLYLEAELGALSRSRLILSSLCKSLQDDNFFRGKRGLDIGCSAGNSLIALAEFGAKEAIGLEISQDRFNTALINLEGCTKNQTERIKILHGSILDTSIVGELGLFEAIFCLDVIEHVDDPQLAIQNIKNLLVKDKQSFCFIQFANCLHYENIIHEPHYDIPGLILLPHKQARQYYHACMGNNQLGYEVSHWMTLAKFEDVCRKNGLLYEYYVKAECNDRTITEILKNLFNINSYIEEYLEDKKIDWNLKFAIYSAVDNYILGVKNDINDYMVSRNQESLYRICLNYSVRNYNLILRPQS